MSTNPVADSGPWTLGILIGLPVLILGMRGGWVGDDDD